MKNSLVRGIIVIFSILVLLALSAGILVFWDIRQTSNESTAETSLANLRLEVKELQLILSQASIMGTSPPLEKAMAAFKALRQLTHSIDTLSKGQTRAGVSTSPNLVSQLESYHSNYLKLLSAHNERNKNHQINQELLTLVKQRLALIPYPISEKAHQDFFSFQNQVSGKPQEISSSQGDLLDSLRKTLRTEITDLTTIKSIDAIIKNYRQDGISKSAIIDQEQKLDQITSIFINQAEATTRAISSTLAEQKALRNNLILLIIFALTAIIISTFLLLRRQLKLFLHSTSLTIKSIDSDGSDGPESNRDDALTYHLKTLTKMGERLAESQVMIEEHNHRWQTLFDTMSDWVLICDADGICIASNHGAKDSTGIDASQLINQPLASVLEGHAGASLSPIIAQALISQKKFDRLKLDIQHPNGSRIPVLISGRPIIDRTGLNQGFNLFIRDLSEEHRTERKLTQATRATNFLNMVMELALLDVDLPELLDRFITMIVELSWIGFQPKAAFFLIDKKSHCLTMMAHRGIDSQVKTACAQLPIGTCLCGRAAQSGKIICADCDDQRHEIKYPGMAFHSHYCLPVHTVAGEIMGVVVLYLNPEHQRDSEIEAILINATTMVGSIIRRRQAENELKTLNQDLERRIESRTAQLSAANQELDSFSYSVSHDLRAPLRAINGFSLALIEDYGPNLPPQAKDYLARIRAGCLRMESLTNDLLNLSRLSRLAINREKVNLSQISQEINEELRAESPYRMVECLVTPNLETMADPTMARVALYNLLANAWKYTGNTPNTRIELGRLINEGKEDVYYIRDNGAGFDMRHAGKLFKAFQRLHTDKQFSGNGIGLATVKRIINCHGGRIWAEAKVDEGATFYFTFSSPNQ